jgi:outer membrane lipoprotein-sorting protein
MRKASKLALIVFAAAFAVACEQKGPAEKAGEKIDEAMSEAKDNAEEAAKKMEDAVEDAGEEIEEAADEVEKKLTDD